MSYHDSYNLMQNLRMREMLLKHQAIDVNVEGTYIGAGRWELKRFVDGIDYCDGNSEAWIWSIGKDIRTGQIVASASSEFYQNPNYECLFLR